MRTKLYLKQVALVLIAVVIIVFVCSLPRIIQWMFANSEPVENGLMPEDSLWYCKELNLQLSFISHDYSSDDTLEGYESYTYIMGDEGCVMCSIILPIRGRTELLVCAQDPAHMEILQKTLFRGECISVDDDCYVIRGDDGVYYRFLRINTFSATEYLTDHENRTALLEHPRSEFKFVERVMQRACDLWKTQFALAEQPNMDDFAISFDHVNEFWLVSYTPTALDTCWALIAASGEYCAVWAGG